MLFKVCRKNGTEREDDMDKLRVGRGRGKKVKRKKKERERQPYITKERAMGVGDAKSMNHITGELQQMCRNNTANECQDLF